MVSAEMAVAFVTNIYIFSGIFTVTLLLICSVSYLMFNIHNYAVTQEFVQLLQENVLFRCLH